MKYLAIMFVSPLYFVMRKSWGAFVLNSLIYGTAVILLVSLVGAFIAPFFWAVAVGHAGWHLRKEVMAEHAEMIATKIAEKMGQPR
ncbi:MAG: hypothetical protein WEG36_11090 [Gemmatimonadota bacterium]